METAAMPGSESQDLEDPGHQGTGKLVEKSTHSIQISPTTTNINSPTTSAFKLKPSAKGVEIAKKRLRAFSIQKKTPITPVSVKSTISNKSSVSGSVNTTVVIGKLAGVKVTPKSDDAEQKKLPKPPKPGANKKAMQVLQKRTLSEIEDMKRKMELIELGIPLGLICPTSTSEKAMPTKAMPPIKSFLDPAKLDEIISEAKKAKAEGREFKFDYQKLLPDYDNPFQRKKDDGEAAKNVESEKDYYKKSDSDKRKSDRYDRDYKRHSSHRRDEKDKRKDVRDKYKAKSNEKDVKKSVDRETDVNLSDYLVCDSWSLDNEEKTNSSSPKRQEISQPDDKKATTVEAIQIKETKNDPEIPVECPKVPPIKVTEKLQPVIDSFKYELDSNEDEVLDMFDEGDDLEKYSSAKKKKDNLDSTYEKLFDGDLSKDTSNDALSDDKFLESVINEIKQEHVSDDEASHDKGLVEYDSPSRESYSPKDERISVTPELDDSMRDMQSRRSDYSDGYRSTESGYKSSGSYKSDSISGNNDLAIQMAKSTVDSLETWSFVLKICQPLLFRHDRNKCYKESHTLPKIWYTVNPKMCNCVKDRAIVYEELETCKMNLVDRVYGCDQIQESEFPKARAWYPRFAQCLAESSTVPTVATSLEWEADDSQPETLPHTDKGNNYKAARSTTPKKSEEISLDREYQRFMEAVWPEAADNKADTSRSTTPVKQDTRKKKAEETQQDDKKKVKKIKLSSEGWSQESEIEDEPEKTSKKVKLDKIKIRKRKHSISSASGSDKEKKRRKANKKKVNKKTKSKLSKRQRISKKYLKKLREKQKKKKRQLSEDEDIEKDNRKKQKKIKKKKLQKKKKAPKKKKAKAKSSSSSSSSTSSSDSSSDSESDTQIKKHKKKSDVKKKRKQSTSESTQSEEDLFDENILNNIKTERLTDDEKKLDFSRHKPREIINVKELQNDFVGSVRIKQEIEDQVAVDEQKLEQTEQTVEKREVKKIPNTESITDRDSENFSPSIPESANDCATEDVTDMADVALENIPIPAGNSHFKEPLELDRSTPQICPEPVLTEATQPEESNLSLCSSQESSVSKDPYEKDDSHLRPSSQNSNYSFNDVINASQGYQKEEEDKFEPENYEHGNYEMYEQLAMAYQSDVAKGNAAGAGGGEWWGSRPIETLVRGRARGEIKCDWRAGDQPAPHARARPSRWGLKPGEVNIVLTGGHNEHYPIQRVTEPVYQIQSLANNRLENTSTGSYDEAYEDMYGASDRLQYGDCFSASAAEVQPMQPQVQLDNNKSITTSASFNDRIDFALKTTVLGEVAKDTEDAEKTNPEKGILMTKSEGRGKRVSFADGYKPGQDSDEEPPSPAPAPPTARKKKSRRLGCAWPCPATHPDHVPLWDALPPPPPPPGSPPPVLSQQTPNMIMQPMLLQQPPPILQQQRPPLLQQPTPMIQQLSSILQQPPPILQQPSSMMQQPPPMLQQQRPPLLQQPPPMLQQPPPMLQQQQLMQQQLLKNLNPAMLQQSPFAMGPKIDQNVSLTKFIPPEPPQGLVSFQ